MTRIWEVSLLSHRGHWVHTASCLEVVVGEKDCSR